MTPATAILGEALLAAFARSLRDQDLSPVTVRACPAGNWPRLRAYDHPPIGTYGFGLPTAQLTLRSICNSKKLPFPASYPKLEIAQQMAGHESARTTGLYDRRDDSVALDEIEKIAY